MNTKRRLDRRAFLMGSGAAAMGGILAGSSSAWASAKRGATPPNVVYIICDQMRGDALSCLGSPNARTPNLDRMASQGVLFENWFSNNPVCLPSRVTAFTGLYPHQHNNLANNPGNVIESFDGSMLGHFHERGYRFGWIGKNHTCSKRLLSRLDFWRNRAREPFRNYPPSVPPWWHSDMFWSTEECHASLNTRDGIEFIRTTPNDQPFFLHLSYFDPHPPYFAPAEFTSRYASADMRIPPCVPAEQLSGRLDDYRRAMQYDRMTDADFTETMRYYYASIEWGVDYQVGRILKTLEEAGLMENTVVLFTSDHGDFMGRHRMVRKGMFLYDDLLHVPMIWYAPGRIAQGHRVKLLAQGIDLFPTLADMTGGKAPSGLPGKTLRPFLQGESGAEEKRTIFACAGYGELPEGYFEHPEALYDPSAEEPLHTRVMNIAMEPEHRTVMARNNDWKLILSETRPPELYNVHGGAPERENVIDRPEAAPVRRELETEARHLWTW